MSTNSPMSLQEEMSSLRKDFHDRLQQELLALSQLNTRDDAGLAQRETLQQLQADTHWLAGSALTFGYSITGEALRDTERLVQEILENPAAYPLGTLRLHLQALTPEHTLQADVIDPSSVATPYSEQVTSDPQNLHVFVLEDDPSTSEMLKIGLASFGYRVSPFSAIETLCAKAIEERPDVLIIETEKSDFTDEKLRNAVCSIRENGMEELPILVVSDREHFDGKLQAARNGVVAFLSKPVNIPSLESNLDYILQQKLRSPYRVLLVDDDTYSMKHHKLMLENWNIVARTLSDPNEVLKVIEEFHPDLMIFDLHMPACTGIELAKVVRYHTHWIHIPILFLSSERNESKQLMAMMQGGEEYLVVLPDTDEHNAKRKLDQLREEFGKVVFRHKDKEFHCSFSAGVCNSLIVDNVDRCIEAADLSLYAAKEAGRNQVHLTTRS